MPPPIVRPLALVALFAAGCSGSSGAPGADPPPRAGDLEATVAHRDERTNAPSFVWLARGEEAAPFASKAEAAARLVPSVARAFGVTDEAARGVTLVDVDDRGRGPVLVRYEQRVGGVEVFRGGARVALTRALRPVAASGFLAATTRGADRPFTRSAVDVLTARAHAVGASAALSPAGSASGYERFDAPGLLAPARAKRVWFPTRGADGEAELEPAWYAELLVAKGPARAWIVSATDGRVLLENDLVRHDAYTYRVYADPVTKLPMDGPHGDALTPHPSGTPDKRALVFRPSELVTLESLPFSKADPWLSPGATTTSGNNVVAYADLAEPDGLGAGDVVPALTGPGTFDHVYDTGASPGASEASMQAAATQLFYVTNFLHDWFYDAGFDEASGNHQLDNLGRGGKAGDPLVAEVQDYSGRNNANALVPPDGVSPRIQMFIFSGQSDASLVVASPASIAGVKPVGIASGFGADAFEVTGEVVLAAGGPGPDPADACEALDGSASGKIVLAHRGTCSFAQKAERAQQAGAIGVIIVNVASSAQPAAPPFMGGQQGGITIPVLSLALGDGAALEAALPAGVSVTMKRSLDVDLDGALDTSIVAHEWGHVLSSRLVGDGMGLTTNQAGGLGEGWGDFTALLLSVRADDPGRFAGTYANGAYATSGSGDDVYFGTRRVPYSIDRTKNALTFAHIQNGTPLPTGVPTSFGEDGSFNAEVHNTGEVWATMLWECYAALLRDRGIPFADAQARMKRYLVASLKLTPPDPTLLEARDALLAAALATDEQDFQLFFRAFARRGAGAGAVGPGKESATNQGVIESFEAGHALEITSAVIDDDVVSCDRDGILDDGETGTVEVTVRNAGSGALAAPSVEIVVKTEGVTLAAPARATLPPLAPFASATAKLAVRVKGTRPAEPIALEVLVTDPALPEGRVVRLTVPTRYEADEARASTIDPVETQRTAWKVTGSGDGEKWARSGEGPERHWRIHDPMFAADHKLTSPPFTLEGRRFSLSFKHKWSLKRSTRRNLDLDGGVVELSVDGGATWKDLSTYGEVDYGVTLGGAGLSDNPLVGRKAYGGTSPGYPGAWVSSHIDVALPKRPESVRVRFRLGATSAFLSAEGWLIDDIALHGVASTPFWAYVPHADACDPSGPTVEAGTPRRVASGTLVELAGAATHPEGAPLTFEWSVVSGPAVTLEDAGSLTPSFVAPEVTEPVTLTLALRAHDGARLSPASWVEVLVEPSILHTAAIGGGCAATPVRSRAPAALGLVGLGLLTWRRRRLR